MLEWLAGLLMLLAVAMQAARFSRAARHADVLLATAATASVPLAVAAGVLLGVAGRPAWGVLCGIAAVAMLVVIARPIARTRRRPGRDPGFRVMSLNMWEGRGDPGTVVRLAVAHEVTVVAIQEMTPESLAGLKEAGISEAFPYSVEEPRARWGGVGLFSSVPLRDVGRSQVDDHARVEAVLCISPDAPESEPTVISIHIESPWPHPAQPWKRHLIDFRQDLASRTGPVVAMGDYNATAHHALFRDLARAGGVDAAAEARAWTIRTFPALWRWSAVIGIDHILLKSLTARSVSSHWVRGSDHRALVADVRYPA